jgi:catechol 2,3-dioxygenase-like lactoylglutathione lyase family enzyme
MNYRLHHVHLICQDLEKMIAFFEDAIGAKFVEHRKFGTADGAMLDLQGTAINLRVARDGEKLRENLAQSNFGYDHIGLQVDNVQAAHDDLVRRGYSFFMPPTETADNIIAFFKGPENITIELLQPLY